MFLLVSLMQTSASNKLERCKDNNKYKVLKGNDEQNFHDDHNIKKTFFCFVLPVFKQNSGGFTLDRASGQHRNSHI